MRAHWLQRQWPFWLGGVFVGLAEVVFYLRYDYFIPVTTGLAQMYAVSERYLFGVDFVARVYPPGIHWVIVGAVFAAWAVARMERDSRAWVHYNHKMMLLAFVGGALFSFGTRLAGGCTTHHFLGGIPAMSIASWAVLLTGIPFAFIAFKIATRLGLGGYFRHQDTYRIAATSHDEPQPGFDAAYRPRRDPLRMALLGFAALLLFVPLGFAFFGDIEGNVSAIGWHAAWMTGVGALLGLGIAKSGFGTECAAMAPESIFMRAERFQRDGLPLCTYRMFRGLLPLQGLLVAVVMLNLAILVRGVWLGGPVPNASGAAGLYWGHLLGGPLLAMGAIFMLGCEVRTYGRLGLGYGTALAALPGFYVGYVPYTLYKDSIDAVVFAHGLTDAITIPQWLSAHAGGGEAAWALIYSAGLIVALIAAFFGGRRYFRISWRELFRRNTDELCQPATARNDLRI